MPGMRLIHVPIKKEGWFSQNRKDQTRSSTVNAFDRGKCHDYTRYRWAFETCLRCSMVVLEILNSVCRVSGKSGGSQHLLDYTATRCNDEMVTSQKLTQGTQYIHVKTRQHYVWYWVPFGDIWVHVHTGSKDYTVILCDTRRMKFLL